MIVPSWHTLLLGPDLLNKCIWPINAEIKPRSWERSPVGTWVTEPGRDGGRGEGAKGGERVCVPVLLPKTGERVCLLILHPKIGERVFLLILLPKTGERVCVPVLLPKTGRGFLTHFNPQVWSVWMPLDFPLLSSPRSILVAAGDRGMALPGCPRDPGQRGDSRMP